MPDIIALRERVIALAQRRLRIGEAMAVLNGIELTLTPAMHAHSAPQSWDEDDEEDDERLRGTVGATYPLFSHPALFAVYGHGDFTDREARTSVGNALHYQREMATAAAGAPEVERGPDPDLASLTRFEVVAIVDAYKRAASESTEALRDVSQAVTRLRAHRCRMPGYVKGSCMGMFGRPDHETQFTYGEGDFALYNRREVAIQPGEPGYRTGRTLTRTVDDHPNVFSARYLAPFLGDETALRAEAALSIIEEASRPLPGEPALSDFQSSRDRKPVEIDYAPGETDVDEDHQASFKP